MGLISCRSVRWPRGLVLAAERSLPYAANCLWLVAWQDLLRYADDAVCRSKQCLEPLCCLVSGYKPVLAPARVRVGHLVTGPRKRPHKLATAVQLVLHIILSIPVLSLMVGRSASQCAHIQSTSPTRPCHSFRGATGMPFDLSHPRGCSTV